MALALMPLVTGVAVPSSIRLLVAFVFVMAIAHAQRTHDYGATCTGTLTGAGTSCTIQIAASNTRWVIIRSAFVQCTAGCVVTQERDGAAASATSVTKRKTNPNATWVAASTANIYQDSNVGVGTPVGPTSITVGSSPSYLSIPGKGLVLEKGSLIAQNYTIKLAAGSGTYTISFDYEERTVY
jgi:hypothetical protein